MANTAQARKRARQADKRREHNRGRRSSMRTMVKKVLVAVESGNREEAQTAYREATSALDVAAKNNLIHRNKAARHKSRLNAKIRAMAA